MKRIKEAAAAAAAKEKEAADAAAAAALVAAAGVYTPCYFPGFVFGISPFCWAGFSTPVAWGFPLHWCTLSSSVTYAPPLLAWASLQAQLLPRLP